MESHSHTPLLNRQRLWLLLVLCCFLVQSLAPRGYMPMARDDGLPTLGFCGDPIPGATELFNLADFAAAPSDAPADPEHSQTHCLFSVGGQVAALAALPVFSKHAAGQSLRLPPAFHQSASRPDRLLPDCRAPPAILIA
ncbi:hypothetical protein [Marinobacter xestospongiae]|uniref:hypothetical protein n=1 Tax=Marinobacter xestospongiae TaxID=994319 RepID=UPI0020036F5D|nr:hypothetical protein [Marinobacter xestospongiae]MCK7567908.1 hypothetical protein [Marinobacter xestospongiae]